MHKQSYKHFLQMKTPDMNNIHVSLIKRSCSKSKTKFAMVLSIVDNLCLRVFITVLNLQRRGSHGL